MGAGGPRNQKKINTAKRSRNVLGGEREEGRGGVKGTEAPKKTMTEEEELRSDSIVVRLRRSVFAVVGGSRFCFSYRWEERC